jgi:hypothetical protein
MVQVDDTILAFTVRKNSPAIRGGKMVDWRTFDAIEDSWRERQGNN